MVSSRPFAAVLAMAICGSAPSRAAEPVTIASPDPVQDCTASDAARWAPLEAAAAQHARHARRLRDEFAVEWRSDDPATQAGVVRMERGPCDGETTLTLSPMDDADRLEQRDALIELAGKALSDAHGRDLQRLFEDAADV